MGYLNPKYLLSFLNPHLVQESASSRGVTNDIGVLQLFPIRSKYTWGSDQETR